MIYSDEKTGLQLETKSTLNKENTDQTLFVISVDNSKLGGI